MQWQHALISSIDAGRINSTDGGAPLTAQTEESIREQIKNELQRINDSDQAFLNNPTYEAFDIVIRGLEENGVENTTPEDITLLLCLMCKKPFEGVFSDHREECLEMLGKTTLSSSAKAELETMLRDAQSPLGIAAESLKGMWFTREGYSGHQEYKQYASSIALCLSIAHKAHDQTILDDSSFLSQVEEIKDAVENLGVVTLSKLFHCANPELFPISATTNSPLWLLYKVLSFRPGNIQDSIRRYFELCKKAKKYLLTDYPNISNLRVFDEIASTNSALLSHLNEKSVIEERSRTVQEKESMEMSRLPLAKNTILYGPPGTGKTYSTVNYAVEICDPDFYSASKDHYEALFGRYNELVEQERVVFTTFHQSFGYEDFIEGIRPDLDSHDGSLSYKLESGIFKELCDNAKKNSEENYVIVIDEINRGNVSRIFGELITLLEESKRLGAEEERQTCLPYSREPFGVPSNVYVLGTMNTADRSLTQLDTALRRRFDFVEVLPNPELLDSADSPTGVDLQRLLTAINERITELYDREHMIGHSYLMGLDSFESLKTAFKKKIIPLLQEYFYDDYSKIQQVLTKDFIKGGEEGTRSFTIMKSDKWEPETFISIYQSAQNDESE